MKHMKTWLLFSFLLFSAGSPAYGVSGAAQVKILTQQLVVLKEQLEKTKEQIEEVKATNDEMLKMRGTIDELYKEYEALADTDLLKDLEYIESKYRELEGLSELNNADAIKEKYQADHKEISERFKSNDSQPKQKPEVVEGLMHKTVVDLNHADAQILYYKDRMKDLSGSGATNKDIETISAQAQATNALLGLEAKKKELEQQRAAQEELKRQVDWNNEFLTYIKSREANDSALEKGIVSQVVVNTLNPKAVYENMMKYSGVAAFFLWFLVFFMAFRLLKESFASLGKGASIGEAISDTNQSIFGYVIYSTAGFGVFAVIFAFMDLFESSTSTYFIHSHLLETREAIVTNNKAYSSWLEITLEYVVDSLNVVNTAVIWLVYQAISFIYVVMNQLIDMVFAIAIAFCWMFGFLAIASRALPEKFQMVDGWLSTIYGLFVWVVAELILMSLLSFVSYGGASWIQSNYGSFGAGMTGLLVWHLFAIIMMVLVIIFKIAAIFFAYMLSRNQSMLGAVGTIPAAIGAMLVSKLVPNNSTHGGNGNENGLIKSMMPEASGDRTRDGLARGAERLSDVANAPIADVVRASSSGLNSLGSNIAERFQSTPELGSGNATAETGTSSSEHSSVTNQEANSMDGEQGSGSDSSIHATPDGQDVDGEQSQTDASHTATNEPPTPRSDEVASGGNDSSTNPPLDASSYANDEPPFPNDYEDYVAMQDSQDKDPQS